jgi:hypothetical protein
MKNGKMARNSAIDRKRWQMVNGKWQREREREEKRRKGNKRAERERSKAQ